MGKLSRQFRGWDNPLSKYEGYWAGSHPQSQQSMTSTERVAGGWAMGIYSQILNEC